MYLEIPDEAVPRDMSAEELRIEVAVYLFREERLTLGQAARLAGMAQPYFQQLLASRKIGLHYGVEDLLEDVKTLDELDRAG